MPLHYFPRFLTGRRALTTLMARGKALDDAHALEAIARRISDLMDQLPEPVIGQGQTAIPPAEPHDPALEQAAVAYSLTPPRETKIPSTEELGASDRKAMPILDLRHECIRVLQEARSLAGQAHARARESADTVASWTQSPLPAMARAVRGLRPPNRGLEEALQELGMYTFSAALRAATESAAIAAESDAPVLLLGETGTGKELFSKLIHRMSSRRDREMVAVNCSGIPKELAESFLFGHVRGAFTGANANQQGKFEKANGSTLFLDELAELTPEGQAKLLRVIEDGKVEPLGSNTLRQVDVRIVAATNHNLDKAVAEGRFREDLYYRLKVFPISLPPLRARHGEIPHLAAALLKQINQRYKRQRQLSKEALRRLEQHDWPGNVRELRGVLERSVLYSRDEVLGAEDMLIEAPASKSKFDGLPEPCPGFSLEDFLRQVKKELIDRALAKSAGNQSAAAELLGVSKQAINNYVRNQADNVD
jgi:transcriptional regulator with GAF, ATPase, and Fis domain